MVATMASLNSFMLLVLPAGEVGLKMRISGSLRAFPVETVPAAKSPRAILLVSSFFMPSVAMGIPMNLRKDMTRMAKAATSGRPAALAAFCTSSTAMVPPAVAGTAVRAHSRPNSRAPRVKAPITTPTMPSSETTTVFHSLIISSRSIRVPRLTISSPTPKLLMAAARPGAVVTSSGKMSNQKPSRKMALANISDEMLPLHRRESHSPMT